MIKGERSKERLPVELSPAEIDARAREALEIDLQIDQHDERAAELRKELGEKRKALVASKMKLREAVTTGREDRSVTVEKRIDLDRRLVQIVRLDTGATVRERALKISEEEEIRQTSLFDEGPKCRVCGCTDHHCEACVERTGSPCSWSEPDLCSACVFDGELVDELGLAVRDWDLDALSATSLEPAETRAGLDRIRTAIVDLGAAISDVAGSWSDDFANVAELLELRRAMRAGRDSVLELRAVFESAEEIADVALEIVDQAYRLGVLVRLGLDNPEAGAEADDRDRALEALDGWRGVLFDGIPETCPTCGGDRTASELGPLVQCGAPCYGGRLPGVPPEGFDLVAVLDPAVRSLVADLAEGEDPIPFLDLGISVDPAAWIVSATFRRHGASRTTPTKTQLARVSTELSRVVEAELAGVLEAELAAELSARIAVNVDGKAPKLDEAELAAGSSFLFVSWDPDAGDCRARLVRAPDAVFASEGVALEGDAPRFTRIPFSGGLAPPAAEDDDQDAGRDDDQVVEADGDQVLEDDSAGKGADELAADEEEDAADGGNGSTGDDQDAAGEEEGDGRIPDGSAWTADRGAVPASGPRLVQ